MRIQITLTSLDKSIFHKTHASFPKENKVNHWGLGGLNMDGASLQNLGSTWVRGLIRDAEGNWVKGYSRAIGVTTVRVNYTNIPFF